MTMKKLPQSIRCKPEVVREAIKINPVAIRDLKTEHRTNRTLMAELITINPACFNFACNRAVRGNPQLSTLACDLLPSNLAYTRADFARTYMNRSNVLQLLKEDGNQLARLHPSFQDDEELVLAAVKSAPALRFASKRIQGMESMIRLACGTDPRAYKHAAKSFRKSDASEETRKYVIAAPDLLKYAMRFTDDESLVRQGVRTNPWILKDASSRLRNSVEIALIALNSDRCTQISSVEFYSSLGKEPRNSMEVFRLITTRCTRGFPSRYNGTEFWGHIGDQIRFSPFVMTTCLRLQPASFFTMPERFINHPKWAALAVRYDPYLLDRIPEKLRMNRNVINTMISAIVTPAMRHGVWNALERNGLHKNAMVAATFLKFWLKGNCANVSKEEAIERFFRYKCPEEIMDNILFWKEVAKRGLVLAMKQMPPKFDDTVVYAGMKPRECSIFIRNLFGKSIYNSARSRFLWAYAIHCVVVQNRYEKVVQQAFAPDAVAERCGLKRGRDGQLEEVGEEEDDAVLAMVTPEEPLLIMHLRHKLRHKRHKANN